MFLLKLAILNVGRNPRRSLITIMAVSVGLAALIFLWGFSDGTTEQQRENVIRLFTGHYQIHAAGFEKNLSTELVLPDPKTILQNIQARPEVVAVTERVKAEALVGTTEHSRGVLLLGIDPERESKVTEIHTHIVEGEFLSPDGAREVLVGFRLQEKLGVGLGDKIVIMTQALDGTLAGYAYRVKGIVKTGSLDLDELAVFITLDSSRELLGMTEAVHEVVIRLQGRAAMPAFFNGITGSLNRSDYEVLSWDEIIPEVN